MEGKKGEGGRERMVRISSKMAVEWCSLLIVPGQPCPGQVPSPAV